MVGISKFGISKLPEKSPIFRGEVMLVSRRVHRISFRRVQHLDVPEISGNHGWNMELPYSWMVSYTSCILNMIFVPYTYIRLVWIVLPTTPRHQKYYVQQTWLDMEHPEHKKAAMVHVESNIPSTQINDFTHKNWFSTYLLPKRQFFFLCFSFWKICGLQQFV